MHSKVDNTTIRSVTYNDKKLESWIHNDAEVFTAEKLVFSASYSYFINPSNSSEKVFPLAIDGVPFVDKSYISEFDSCVHINSQEHNNQGYEERVTIGQLTDKALQKFDYARVYYECGSYVSSAGDHAYGYCEIADRSELVYVSATGDSLSESGFVIVPASSLHSTNVKAYFHIWGSGDNIDVGIAITKIVLTNEKPTE